MKFVLRRQRKAANHLNLAVAIQIGGRQIGHLDRRHQTARSAALLVDRLHQGKGGGSNDMENLWPEPVRGEWSAAKKDALEQKLHSMVCDGTLTLKQAQTALKKNWVAAYTQYVGTATAHGQ